MGVRKEHFRYRLGIDGGVASLGIAIFSLGDDDGPMPNFPDGAIVGGSVRTWPVPEGASERKEKRGMRRNIERRRRRLDRLSELLADKGIGHPRKGVPKEILELSPIKLRAKASREKVELAHLSRALLHIARHRGSSAIRESDTSDDHEKRQTAVAIRTLRQEMQTRGFTTYGQYLRWRERKNMPIRINQQKMPGGKDGYAFYPSRDMLHDEFKIIWETQARFYPDILTEDLKQRVEDELFFQRVVTPPPPGKCPYFPNESRLPRASRLFQERRIYEEANNLRFHSKAGEGLPYGIAERDKIVARLLDGEDLTFAEIKKTVGLKRTDKVSLEESKSRNGIAGYPFDRNLGGPDILSETWFRASDQFRDQILNVLATVHDDGKAAEALTKLLGGDREAAERALQAPLPTGWGRMGLTATRKLLEELKNDVVPARVAEDQAGLVHAMTPDGVVYDRLPYYGEILVGHTVDPIWVSDYRRDTDRPPETDSDEQKYGRIPNPVVHLALNQMRKVVNAVIDRYGLPETIHIELARELNKSAEARAEEERKNRKNKDESDKAADELRKHSVTVNRLNIQKFKLCKEQGCVCVYTGEPIDMQRLFGGDIDVDHILPRSKTFLDSMANKVVCVRSANADKDNRPPYMAFKDNPKYDWDAIMRRVEKLPENKQWRFRADAMKKYEEDEEGFRARYGTDNSYIARVARQYLSCLYGEPQRVVAVSSHIVSLLRGKWGLNKVLGGPDAARKSRADHRHHFVDALVAACATRGIIKAIQTEAARCEKEGLEVFVETIVPPFGKPKEFFSAVREAALERVSLSRKMDHSTKGQLHEDTMMGIVDGPDDSGAYDCRKRKKLSDYATLAALRKPKIQDTLPDLPEIQRARSDLEAIRDSIESFVGQATRELEDERKADITAGKKGRQASEMAIYSRAVQLHADAGGKTAFILYEKQKLVNVRRAGDANRPYGGYISGRNHRKDFYLDANGKLHWELVSMIDANDGKFTPEAKIPGNTLLWSAHKEDTLLMDEPGNPTRRIRVVVAKLSEAKMGVIPEYDARMASAKNEDDKRQMWEKGLSFFRKSGTRRIKTDPLGRITQRFPSLPRSGKAKPPP